MTTVALGHVMDISATRPAAFVTTAEDAAAILATDGCPKTAAGIQQTLLEIRAHRPTLVPYLTHPSIILGIARGRCAPTTLIRWLEELEAADDYQDETPDVDDCFP